MNARERSIVVIGSVNLDLVANVERLPRPGETVSGATLSRFPGGKGANQALAARRLGAKVTLIARVGRDTAADEALALLRRDGVDLSLCAVDDQLPTGMALIAVAASGENHIVVAPGANRTLCADALQLPAADALLCQLEIPVDVLCHAARQFPGFLSVNLAPAAAVPPEVIARADLLVVNEIEADYYGPAIDACGGLVAVTSGKSGAVLKKGGRTIAEAKPPAVEPVDTVGAGDAFCAALTVALIDGLAPAEALRFACAAGAAATTRPGAQPSLPDRATVEALLASSLVQ